METSVLLEVERILNYTFKNKRLLEEALTHPSINSAPSYERLEFLGDAALGLAFSNDVYRAYPNLDQGEMTLLRAANIGTEKLARVAIKHGLYTFVRHNAPPSLDDKVREFAEAVSEEDGVVVYSGLVMAPKILADIVESVAAAIYVDVDFDLERLWVIFRGLLEPIVTWEDLEPQPVTRLYEMCQKQGKKVDIQFSAEATKHTASVFVDGEVVASCSSDQQEKAKLKVAREAFYKLVQPTFTDLNHSETIDEDFGSSEIKGAKQKLHELCTKKKWPKPYYKIEKEEGPSNVKKFVCSVEIATVDGKLYIMGDEKTRVRDAENSAASLLMSSFQQSNFL